MILRELLLHNGFRHIRFYKSGKYNNIQNTGQTQYNNKLLVFVLKLKTSKFVGTLYTEYDL